MDIRRYMELKEKGMVTLKKVGAAYAAEVKRFDPATGEALPVDVASIDIDALRAQAVDYRALATIVDELVADIEALA